LRVLRHPSRVTLAVCLGFGGLGVPIALWVLSALSVRVPKVALYALLVVALCMIFVPWMLLGWNYLRRSPLDEIDPDEDGPALWAAQQQAKEERIRRIAEKEINR
jgi:hypothetical protein